MVTTYQIDGLFLQTGDILCTTCEGEDIAPGQFWRLLGRLVPGVVDHVAIYLGPGGMCVESALKGVSVFNLPGNRWEPARMVEQRGHLYDRLYGVAYPLAMRGLTPDVERGIRQDVRAYCLKQAQERKPYNLNFLDPDTEQAFYCSQLAFKAYLRHGIDLNTGVGVPDLPGSSRIIFPQEIWSGCEHQKSHFYEEVDKDS